MEKSRRGGTGEEESETETLAKTKPNRSYLKTDSGDSRTKKKKKEEEEEEESYLTTFSHVNKLCRHRASHRFSEDKTDGACRYCAGMDHEHLAHLICFRHPRSACDRVIVIAFSFKKKVCVCVCVCV